MNSQSLKTSPNPTFFHRKYLKTRITYDTLQAGKDNAAETDQKNESRHMTSIQLGDGSNLSPERRVQSIMVFYSDNSFEVFEPARKSVDD